MMRRLHLPARCTLVATTRAQSTGSSNTGKQTDIANYARADAGSTRGRGGGVERGGRGRGGRDSAPQDSGHYARTEEGPVSADAKTKFTLETLAAEAISDRDPLGGMWHKDYYRDPAKGYAPQFAPRDFADGGALNYHHPQSDTHYQQSVANRSTAQHDVERKMQAAKAARAQLRSRTSTEQRSSDLTGIANEYTTKRGASATDFSPVTAMSAEFLTPSQENVVANLSDDPGDAFSHISPKALNDAIARAMKERELNQMRESFRDIHGFRQWEATKFENNRHHAAPQRPALNAARAQGVREGRMYGQIKQGPLVPPSSMREAQSSVRENAVDDERATVSSLLKKNTSAANPRLPTDFAEHVGQITEAKVRAQRAEDADRVATELGLGRQTPLVTERGPGMKDFKLHRNSETLLHAKEWAEKAYQGEPAVEALDRNPYVRRQLDKGVSKVISNTFDADRRAKLAATGGSDPLEQSTVHLGVPKKQQVDDLVRARRGFKGSRPMKYFTPFPSDRDLRLANVYDDVLGFPFFTKARTEPQDMVLLARYREHHAQRKNLALKHGLEPRVGETVTERNARREKLDELCEKTEFVSDRKDIGTATMLRELYGAYALPSPAIVENYLQQVPAGLTYRLPTADTSEPILSYRYLERVASVVATYDPYFTGPNRQAIQPLFNKASVPDIPMKMDSTTLRKFTDKERVLYNEYVERCNKKSVAQDKARRAPRWFFEHKNTFGECVAITAVGIQEVVFENDGTTGWVAEKAVVKDTTNNTVRLTVDKKPVRTTGNISALSLCLIRLETGEDLMLDAEQLATYPVDVTEDAPNKILNYGLSEVPYNRINYVEAQDHLWEQGTYRKEQGWSPATEGDVFFPTMAVLARRPLVNLQTGDFERAEIVSFDRQPFWNPDPKCITVKFSMSNDVYSIPLSDVMVWQLTWCGPERNDPERTTDTTTGLKRYVDVTDPEGTKRNEPSHFLDVYAKPKAPEYRGVKNINDVDNWRSYDHERAENHRQLSISHRKDYMANYMHQYTPWNFITLTENEHPVLEKHLTYDDVGPSYFFNPYRFWRYKRRPTGYVRNYEEDVRDFFEYADGVVPWVKAKNLRTHWETREHNPTPAYHNPSSAPHRNSVTMLPTNLWEADKKTGQIITMKDTLKNYTGTDAQSWSNI